jgi:hypothetical protein
MNAIVLDTHATAWSLVNSDGKIRASAVRTVW